MIQKILSGLLIVLILMACSTEKKAPKDGPLQVVCTTGMIQDAVQKIGGDRVQAEALMGPGVDPHLYKASQGDLQKLNKADVIFYNGLMLEGKMGEILEKLGRLKPVFAVAESIPQSQLRPSGQYENAFDPHIWFDVTLWKQAAQAVAQGLQKTDSINASYYQGNLKTYLTELDSLHEWVRQEIARIPETQRILVTAHDAFGYFGDAYGIRVEGLQGISTVSDFGLRDISDLSELIISNRVKAIFVETSVSDKAIRAVIDGCRERGHDVRIGGSLYSDAMGAPGTPEGTYLGMFRKNVETIVTALL